MQTKTLQSLKSELFVLPEASLFQVKGGTLSGETRYKTWTPHGDHEDMDGYASDTETTTPSTPSLSTGR